LPIPLTSCDPIVAVQVFRVGTDKIIVIDQLLPCINTDVVQLALLNTLPSSVTANKQPI